MQARDRTGRWLSWEKPDPSAVSWQLALGCAAVALLLVLVAVGAVTVVRWLAGLW
ncbi:hypothetical protein [Cellulomonas cellasea]|uniref:hypothetical protein n=1 Tax=Cellulomonas cellasea TaxID=43670 RepID=UPI001476C644|nr:hypothetical protein [Cellulomonas cellasea]